MLIYMTDVVSVIREFDQTRYCDFISFQQFDLLLAKMAEFRKWIRKYHSINQNERFIICL